MPESSWRGFVGEGGDVWNTYPICILVSTQARGSRGSSYEVYIGGKLKAERPTLAAAKTYVTSLLGEQKWKKLELPPVTVIHKRYGPTSEFTDPVRAYVVEP